MARVNEVSLEGKCYRVEVKETKTGKKMVSFGLAFAAKKVGDNWENQYINVIGFDFKDIPLEKSYVKIKGKLTQDSWEKDGKKQSTIKVIANEINIEKPDMPQSSFDEDDIAF